MLRLLTNTPDKRSAVVSLLSDNPGPFLVYAAYIASVEALTVDLRAAGYNVTPIHGNSPKNADERIRIANTALRPSHLGGNKDVIVSTIPSLKEGVDLSHARTVVFFEDDFVPGSNYQALSRVRRHRNLRDEHGNTVSIVETTDTNPDNDTPVLTFHVLTRDTIDERIFAVQSGRALNVKGIVNVEMES